MIYIGTSGFSYDDWKGRFYPDDFPKKDMLEFYAARFPAVEIDSTYYNIPGVQTFESMNRRTPREFRFAVKAHRDMTHSQELDQQVFVAFLFALGPLLESGKLGCVLAQFPFSFNYNQANLDRLEQFREHIGGLPTVVEFRNEEWYRDETFELLRRLNLGFCCVDEPSVEGLMPSVVAATSSIGYVRFHGRNAAKWRKHDHPHERYDYLYNEDELQEWVPRTREVESKTQHTYVFFNNHYRGKSAQNAQLFARMLNIPLPAESAPRISQQLSLGDL